MQALSRKKFALLTTLKNTILTYNAYIFVKLRQDKYNYKIIIIIYYNACVFA